MSDNIQENQIETTVPLQEEWNKGFQDFVNRQFLPHTQNKTAEPTIVLQELHAEGVTVQQLLDTLQARLNFVRNKYASATLPPKMLEATHLSVLCHGLALYLSHSLSTPQFDALSADVSATCFHWMHSLMKLPEKTQGAFTTSQLQSRLLAIEAAVHTLFPQVSELGFRCLPLRPVIYTSVDVDERQLHSLRFPRGFIRTITSADTFEAQIQRDRETDETPLFCLLSADRKDLGALQAACEKHNIWCHVEGDELALLVSNPPAAIQCVLKADSFTVSPGNWYGLGLAAQCTFFLSGIPSGMQSPKESMTALPLWFAMQCLGRTSLENIVVRAGQLAHKLHNTLTLDKSLELKTADHSLTVLFRYVPVTTPIRPWASDTQFLNTLNQQLVIDLAESCVPLGIETVSINNHVWAKFSPLPHPELMEMNIQKIERFYEQLKRYTHCVNGTLSCTSDFEEAVQQIENLQNVHVPNYVGLGAVQYIPSYLRGHDLAPEVRRDIDELNIELAKRLSESDLLYSSGRTSDGAYCVCVGVETKELSHDSAKHYAEKIRDCASTLSLSEKIQQTIADIVQKAIKDAENKIKIESEVASNQNQGIIRSIPLVGSVVKWWSPVKIDVKGKAFDIGTTSVKNFEVDDRSPGRPSPRNTQTPPPRTNNNNNHDNNQNNNHDNIQNNNEEEPTTPTRGAQQ